MSAPMPLQLHLTNGRPLPAKQVISHTAKPFVVSKLLTVRDKRCTTVDS
jgi:hypothetical protein